MVYLTVKPLNQPNGVPQGKPLNQPNGVPQGKPLNQPNGVLAYYN